MLSLLKRLCCWLPLLLPGALGSCTVYDRVFHPYRLPSPTMNPELRAKVRAAEKARHKGTSFKPAEASADADGTEPAAPGAAKEEKKSKSYSDLSAGTRAKYNKQLLLKKPRLERRRLHHYDQPRAPRLTRRADRRRERRLQVKGKGNDYPEAPAGSADPAPDPTPPKAKTPKAPVPKPDPTQPPPGK